jgi:DNA-binding NarL/FixJ family response regulator
MRQRRQSLVAWLLERLHAIATKMSEPIRVVVVDDMPLTRTMLREALDLAGGFDVVGEASDGNHAVEIAAELHPDVVLMDVKMPQGGGIQAARTITSQNPSTKIVALTWLDDANTVREMIAAGAMGYVVKGGTMDDLAAAIRRARDGEPELDEKVIPAAVEDLRRLLEEEVSRREEVERLARSRAEFVQVLSHELRTPLTVISGALRMLRDLDLTEEQAAILSSAVRRSEQLEFMAHGLELVASTPGSDDLASPSEAIRGAARRLASPPEGSFDDDDQWAGVPQQYVERVAYELMMNAERHGQPPIEVRAFRQDGHGVVEVRDAGGWSATIEDFGAFFQQDMSGTRGVSGFGLGLFVSTRLCEACGGSLTIREEDGKTVAEARFRLR